MCGLGFHCCDVQLDFLALVFVFHAEGLVFDNLLHFLLIHLLSTFRSLFARHDGRQMRDLFALLPPTVDPSRKDVS